MVSSALKKEEEEEEEEEKGEGKAEGIVTAAGGR